MSSTFIFENISKKVKQSLATPENLSKLFKLESSSIILTDENDETYFPQKYQFKPAIVTGKTYYVEGVKFEESSKKNANFEEGAQKSGKGASEIPSINWYDIAYNVIAAGYKFYQTWSMTASDSSSTFSSTSFKQSNESQNFGYEESRNQRNTEFRHQMYDDDIDPDDDDEDEGISR